MSLVVIVDLRSNNGQCVVIHDEYDNPMQFSNMAEVRQVMDGHPLGGFPFWILDLDTGMTR